jgi:tetratricopeptide (TPR) repeat protein
MRGELEFYSGRYGEAKECFRRTLAIFQEQASHVSMAETLHWFGEACLMLEEYDQARAHLEESLLLARRHNCPHHLGLCLIKLGTLELETGALEVAEAAYADARLHFQRIQVEHTLPWIAYAMGVLRLAQGDCQQAGSFLDQAQRQFTANSHVLWMARCHLAQAIVAALTGRQADAVAHLQHLEPHLQDLPALLLGAAEVMAVICRDQGRWDDAMQVDSLVEVARREWNIPRLPSGQSWYEPIIIQLRQAHAAAYPTPAIVSSALLVDHISTLLEEVKHGEVFAWR